MKPSSNSPCDARAFAKLKRILPTIARSRRGSEGAALAGDLPQEIAFKLTNRCNLRCAHCYQWSAEGHHHDLEPAEQQRDLDLSIVEKVFRATREIRSNVYLWGGEPLVYRQWDGLAELLREDPRWTTVCTNGLGIAERLESLLAISDYLEVYVSVDGPAAANDAVRGRLAFQRAVAGIDRLVEERRHGRFRGEISVNCVATAENATELPAFVESCEERGIDTVYLALPWFLSEQAAREMDAYCEEFGPWTRDAGGGRRSWHAYTYRFDPTQIDALLRSLDVIGARDWRLKVRYNPEVSRDEIHDFLGGSSRPAQGKTRCLSIFNRMDIFPDGTVVSCKFFPESIVGDLTEQGVDEVWRGAAFERLRRTVGCHGLMPVCAKCNLLYTRGA